MNTPPLRLVICGTDTDVGKTVVSALFVQGLEATYWKPVQSGTEGGGDRQRVIDLLELPKERWQQEAYAFQAPVSPHWAAEREGRCIDPELLKVPAIDGPLVVETAGGLMVPLTRHWLQIQQLERWRLPVVLVARSELGTLNHTLLSLEALRTRNIAILGLVINGPPHTDNPRTLNELGDVPLLCELPPLEELNAAALARQWRAQNVKAKVEAEINRLQASR
ncbi:MAG: dethiobiotin synthase [Synechococcus sp. SP2 MAG]|jgi:dethiobiotin synthetase|nr:dethiobiotin synthase [Synechococcus sp. SP2 MAG]